MHNYLRTIMEVLNWHVPTVGFKVVFFDNGCEWNGYELKIRAGMILKMLKKKVLRSFLALALLPL